MRSNLFLCVQTVMLLLVITNYIQSQLTNEIHRINTNRDDKAVLKREILIPRENQYQWIKSLIAITEYFENQDFTIKKLNSSHAGNNYCLVKNPDFPELTLMTKPFTLVTDGSFRVLLSQISIGENKGKGDNVATLRTSNSDQASGHS